MFEDRKRPSATGFGPSYGPSRGVGPLIARDLEGVSRRVGLQCRGRGSPSRHSRRGVVLTVDERSYGKVDGTPKGPTPVS